MTGISDSPSLTSLLGGATSATAAVNSAEQNMLNQEDFFSLMIAQFQNQDPFKPMESGEFLGQIAQFSTVDGINTLNSSFGDLRTQMTSDQTLQASGLIDRDVLVPTDSIRYAGQGTVDGRIHVPTGADRVTVERRRQAALRYHLDEMNFEAQAARFTMRLCTPEAPA